MTFKNAFPHRFAWLGLAVPTAWLVLWFVCLTEVRAQTGQQPQVAPDQCVVHVALAADAKLAVDGRDYGGRRTLTFQPLLAGQVYRSVFQAVYSDGRTEQRDVEIAGGRQVQVLFRSAAVAGPQLVVQTRRTWDISYDLSPDGKYLAVGENDNTASVWELATGRRLRTFSGNSLGITNNAFHPDGRHLAAAGLEQVSIFDLTTGKRVGLLSTDATENRVYFDELLITSDGKHVAGMSYHFKDTNVTNTYVWRFDTGELRHKFTEELLGKSLAVDPNGRLVATAGQIDYDEAEIKTRDVESGKLSASWRIPGNISAINFSSNGEELVGIVGEGGLQTVYFWESASGKETHKLRIEIKEVATFALSADGRQILVGGHDSEPNGTDTTYRHKVELWDKTSSKRLTSYAFDTFVNDVAFIPNTDKVLVNDTIFVKDSGEKLRAVNGTSGSVTSVHFCHDGRLCVIDEVLWDFAAGIPLRVFPGRQGRISPDGRFVFTVGNLSSGSTVTMWDARTGLAAQRFDGHREAVISLATTPDGQRLATGGADKRAIVWDVASGRRIFDFPHDQMIHSLEFSEDGRWLLTGTGNDYLRLGDPCKISIWDLYSGQLIRTLESPDDHHSVTVSPTGRYLVSAGGTTAILWDASSGRRLQVLTGHQAEVHSVAVSPDESLVLTTSRDGTARLWSIADGQLLRTMSSRGGWLRDAEFSRDGRHILTASTDGTARLWNASTGEELASLVRIEVEVDAEENDWLVATPEGLFDGSVTGRQAVTYRVDGGFEVVPVDRFFQDFFHPGLLAEIWQGNYPLPKAILSSAKSPAVRIVDPTGDGVTGTNRVSLRIEVTDRGGGISGPWLKHNGARLLVTQKPKMDGDILRQEIEVALVPGTNQIEVCAASADGSWESEPAQLTLECSAAEQIGQFYLLAIGINNYADSTMNLRFAAPDARSFADLFRQRGPVLYGSPDRLHIVQLTDEAATKEAISRAFAELAAQIKPEDVFCLFMAGHGTMVGQRYYFIPHEFRPTEKKLDDDIQDQGLSGDELDDLVSRVPALKRISIYDTCQSGGALAPQRTARNPFAFRRALEEMGRAQGSFIIAATAATDDAQEVPDLGHGVLTYSLLAGLGAVESGPLRSRSAPRSDAGELVLVRDWFSFAQDEVPSLTRTFFGQEQFVRFIGSGTNFPILPGAK